MKRVLFILTIVLYFTLLASYSSLYSKTEAVEPIASVAELRCLFNFYNRTYFFNHLPPTEIKWDNMHSIKRMGQTSCTDTGCLIKMDPVYNIAYPVAQATLLHEMCHVETRLEFDDHGKKWDACMDRLWISGAFKGLI